MDFHTCKLELKTLCAWNSGALNYIACFAFKDRLSSRQSKAVVWSIIRVMPDPGHQRLT